MAILPAAPARTIENRLVVWGIWGMINFMVEENEYNEAEVDIEWEGNVVAHIYFTRPLDYQGDSVNTTQTQIGKALDLDLSLLSNQTSNSGVETTNDNSSNSLDILTYGDFDFLPKYMLSGKTLTPVEAFMTVIATLKNAAPAAATDKILGPFASSAEGIDAYMSFFLHRRRTPRTTRPFFQFIHVIKACRVIPGYLLENRKFADLGFGIGVNGVLVGDGFIEKK